MMRIKTPSVWTMLSLLSNAAFAGPMGTAFTYQGRLQDGSSTANGIYDLRFALYDAADGTGQIANALTNSATGVSNGLFTVTLDFGPVPFISGQACWLQVGVRTNGLGAFTELTPRQPLTPAPYAIYTPSAGSAASALTVAAGGVGAASLQANAVTSDKIAEGTISETDLNPVLASSTFWRLGGNAGTTPGSQFLGTTDNQPLELRVNGLRGLRLELDATSPTVIGGYSGNSVGSGSGGSVIAGGGEASLANTIGGNSPCSTIGGGVINSIHANTPWATIGGGGGNTIQADAPYPTIGGGRGNMIESNAQEATIGGGSENRIQTNAQRATIGGGWGNIILSNAQEATVGGGMVNVAGGDYASVGGGYYNGALAAYATIAGGRENAATNTYATVPGGRANLAGGSYSLAAGRRAKALHHGTFVWADSTDADFASTGDNQFLLRASGGVGIGTDQPQSALDVAGTVTASAFVGTGAILTSLDTADNQPLELRVNGQRVLRLEPDATSPTLIGGYSGNRVGSGSYGSVISGGGESDFANAIGDNSPYSTIGGGDGNSIETNAPYATIGGGAANMVQTNASCATIGGGGANQIQTDALNATIAGGIFNVIWTNAAQTTIGGGISNTIQAGAFSATIGGGWNNLAGGENAAVGGGSDNRALAAGATVAGGRDNAATNTYATVPGGRDNLAAGSYSFAAGLRAKAHGAGSFVWGDSNDFDVHAWGDNQFVGRATGGYWLFSAVDSWGIPTAGATLAAGSGTWGSLCDRNAKANCIPADPRAVLDKVTALPIASWNYKAQDPSIRHIGPMAQDFHAAFGIGDSDKTITTVDADGVALAAIQGLNQKVESGKQKAESRMEKLEAENAELQARLAQLERLVNTLTARQGNGRQ